MSKTKVVSSCPPPFDPTWLGAPPDRALALVREAGERGADLVATWIAGKNAGAVAEIAADDAAPAAARKAARRGLNVLKSRGVAVPERRRDLARPNLPRDTFEAWFRAPDGAGTSAFTVGARSPAGRYRLLDIIMQEGVGLVSVVSMEMSRTQLRATFDGIEQRFGHGPAPVPISWARARIGQARGENDARHTPVPLAFESHLTFLELDTGATGASPQHPADDAGLALPSREGALARSSKLHGVTEMRGWLPAATAMQTLLEEIARAEGTLLGVETSAIQSKVAEIVDRVTDSYFVPARRAQTASNMRDAAISLLARGETARAADLLATANAVLDIETISAAHAIPFLRGFFEKALGLAAARAARLATSRESGLRV